jgi:hypothetical protein
MSRRQIPTREEVEIAHERRFTYMSMLKTRFIVPHLIALYRKFEGDLLLAVVLGEIAIRNMQGIFEVRPEEPYTVLDLEAERAFVEDRNSQERMRPANTLSVSIATGIPRETVRRKIDKLVANGWVERRDNGHLFLLPQVGIDLREFDREETIRYSIALGALMTILERTDDGARQATSRGTSARAT